MRRKHILTPDFQFILITVFHNHPGKSFKLNKESFTGRISGYKEKSIKRTINKFERKEVLISRDTI